MQTVNCNIHNRFDVEVIDAQSREIKQRAQAENIILDALWARLMGPSAYNQYIHYGTGSGTPTANRTQLFAFLGSKQPATADDYLDIVPSSGALSLRRKITIAENEHVGSTLSEVGIGYSDTAATLCTHAMLKDMNGNTVTIVKTATDIINIYATVFVHWNSAGYNGIKVISNKTNAFLCDYLTGKSVSYVEPNRVTYTPGWESRTGNEAEIPYNNGAVSGKQGWNADAASVTYNQANKTISIVAPRLAAASGNIFYGIKKVVISTAKNSANICHPVMSCCAGNSWYAGSSITGEPVGTGDGTTKDFSTIFQYKGGGKVYVNGIELQSGVTIANTPQATDAMSLYWELYDVSGDGYPIPYDYSNWGGSMLKGAYAIYYNPYYSLGTNTISAYGVKIESSNDLLTWETHSDVAGATGTVTIPEANRYDKYWKITAKGSVTAVYNVYAYSASSKNIHFETPPASGAVITADYTTETIAKDENHVFDCSITIQLGELVV